MKSSFPPELEIVPYKSKPAPILTTKDLPEEAKNEIKAEHVMITDG